MRFQDVIQRRIQPLVQGGPVYYALNIAAGVLLKRIDLFLRGNIVFSGGSASGTQYGENPAGLIQTIQVDANPIAGGLYKGGTIKKLFPRSILRGNIFDRGRFQDDISVGTNGVVGAATTYALNCRLPLYFANPRITEPLDTALRLDQFQQVLLTVTMDNVTTMLSGNDRTVDITGLYIDVVPYLEYNPSFLPVGTMYETDFTKQVTQANARLALDTELSKSEAFIDALVMAETTNKVLANTILNRATFNSGTEMFFDKYSPEIQGQNRDYLSENTSITNATSMTGLYYVDFTDGEALNSDGGLLSHVVPDLSGVLDVSNPGTDRLIVRTRRLAPRLDAAKR